MANSYDQALQWFLNMMTQQASAQRQASIAEGESYPNSPPPVDANGRRRPPSPGPTGPWEEGEMTPNPYERIETLPSETPTWAPGGPEPYVPAPYPGEPNPSGPVWSGALSGMGTGGGGWQTTDNGGDQAGYEPEYVDPYASSPVSPLPIDGSTSAQGEASWTSEAGYAGNRPDAPDALPAPLAGYAGERLRGPKAYIGQQGRGQNSSRTYLT